MPEIQTGSADRSKSSGPADKPLTLLARHEWTIIGLLALLAFLLGCWGYARIMTFSDGQGPNTVWDVVYASLQLFIFEGPDETYGWPIQLQIARALAPTVLLYTAAVAIFKRVETQVALYRLLFHKRRFVVVCGVGDTGFRIARDYCQNTDKQVVVIDIDPMNAMAAELANYGAILIYGNAMDPIVLHKARVVYAKEVFLCTDDDQANIATAKNIERLSRSLSERELHTMAEIVKRHEPHIAGEPPYAGLRAFLCVDAPDLYEVFANHPFFATNSERYAIWLFNRKETIARNIFTSCAPDLYYRPNTDTSAPAHILFIGFESLVQELIVQTALTAHYPNFRPARITVMCTAEKEEAVGRFQHRYPHLANIVDLNVVYADPLTVTPEQWRNMQAATPFSVCYVGMHQDVEGILAARRLNRLRRLESMPMLNFVVCLNQQSFLAEIIDDDFLPIDIDKGKLPEHTPIEYYETLDETITITVVVNEALDTLARTLHNAYLQTQLDRGDTRETNPSLIPWSELPAHKKKANQHAAAHMNVKLRSSGCVALDENNSRAEIDFPPDSETLEVLAQLEHRRWMADKHLAGYSYGEQRDEDRMLHPDLIPWEQLTEADKEKDRDNIRQIPELLHLQGQKICNG
ncbi:MAG: RyR domain-containing protein [Gammaproteobacteria bacterium]|nr:RyR domain-containing protein [Gammaproteobacteria bacterium]